MKAVNFVKTAVWIAFLTGVSAAGVKYVAVVETDVDAASGASAEINPAEVREITAEIRRQATENLPLDRYNVMTSETVQSMGGAVLEECAEENCVIALGSRIGADYIARGTLSKFQTRFTLAIELYETENGTLVVTSEAVRSENLGELLDKASTACANMFKKFVNAKGGPARKVKPAAVDAASSGNKRDTDGRHDRDNTITLDKDGRGYYFAPKYQFPVGTPVSWGGVNLEGGLTWRNGVFLGLDLSFGINDVSDNYFESFEDINATNASIYVLGGIGVSLGRIYDLWEQLQLVYGGSAGLWVAGADPYTYKGYDDAGTLSINYLAPFIKLRWNFVELTYRGLLGYKFVNYDKKWDAEKGQHTYENKELTKFGWNNHQLMAGFYLSRAKREARKREGMRYDFYFAPKYQTSLISGGNGINLEGGLIWGDGAFLGIDLGDAIGVGGGPPGIGFSLGNVYDLWGALQLAYGGSVGSWTVRDGSYEYKGYHDARYKETDYLAPFVRLRWGFTDYLPSFVEALCCLELTYRGLLGDKNVKYGENESITQFGWNNHQLMLGLYIATKKRGR